MKISLEKRTVIEWIGFCAGLVLLALLVFRCILDRDAALFTTDDNIGLLSYAKSGMPHFFLARWYDSMLLGIKSHMSIKWTWLLLWVLPVRFYANWIHAIDLGLASLFLAWFLRMRNLAWSACILSFLSAFWVGTNLTLTYAGHSHKFGVLMFAALFLCLIEKAVKIRRLSWYILAGGAMGGMLLEQQDVALFTGMFLGAYAVFLIVRKYGWNLRVLSVRLFSIVVVALLIAGPSSLSVYFKNKPDNSGATSNGTNQQWDFSTQWSVPPSESIDFIAPGFYGWRSSEPEGPYWGITGQSPNWKQTKQGFRNFRLESVYLGSIPVIMALLAIFIALMQIRNSGSKNENDRERYYHVCFWGGVALFALLLSFGKYFPLYSLFYKLPGISSIRCPNKFLHIFQIAIAILAGYGFDFVSRRRVDNSAKDEACEESKKKSGPRNTRKNAKKERRGRGKDTLNRGIRVLVIVVMVLGVILMLWGSVVAMSRSFQEQQFVDQGWGQMAPVIVGNIIRSLVHSGIMMLICGGAILMLHRPEIKFRYTAISGLIMAMVIDVLLLSQYYIKPMNMEANVGENAVVKYLKKNLGYQRVYMLNQAGFYNNWLTTLFPYYGFSVFNVAQMPRMPADYKAFLGRVGRNPVRMWELSSISYILAPAQVLPQIQKDPTLREHIEPVMGFNVFPFKDGLRVVETMNIKDAQHLILKFKKALPRYSLISDWDVVSDKEALNRLIRPDFDPHNEVLIARDLPGLAGLEIKDGKLPGSKDIGTVEVDNYRGGEVSLKVSAKRPCILLAVQKYDPGWKAFVDGEPVNMLRCNYLAQGVYVDKGLHGITLSYSRSIWPLWVQGFGVLVCLIAVGQLCWTRFGHKEFSQEVKYG
ncbi:hypothetical protein ACFLS1_03025 [Verrucomicrobiota bacterium]